MATIMNTGNNTSDQEPNGKKAGIFERCINDSEALSLIFIVFAILPLVTNLLLFLLNIHSHQKIHSGTDLVSVLLVVFGSTMLTRSLSRGMPKKYNRRFGWAALLALFANLVLYILYWPNLMIGLSQYFEHPVNIFVGLLFGLFYSIAVGIHVAPYLIYPIGIIAVTSIAIYVLRLFIRSNNDLASIAGSLVLYSLLSVLSFSSLPSFIANSFLALILTVYFYQKTKATKKSLAYFVDNSKE